MKQYQDTLRYVLENGVTRSDRTGVGRHGVFSPPDEIYDLKDGFPLTSLREINPKAMIDELLWFISGSTNVCDLRHGFFWDRWKATESDVVLNHRRKVAVKEEIDLAQVPSTVELSDEERSRIGTIGNLYGVSWRKAPAPKGDFLPIRTAAQYPKSLVIESIPVGVDDSPLFTYESYVAFLDSSVDKTNPLYDMWKSSNKFLHEKYWSHYDQLNELIIKLKTTPNSSRLRVSAYITDYMAFEDFTPQKNVADGRAALTPCHTFFQCFVNPAKVEGGKPTLDLKLTLTSSDVPVGRVYNIAQYALLTHMLAQVSDMEAGRLIISTGDAHIYCNQFEAVDAILARSPSGLPTLKLNPNIKDIFAFKHSDIEIVDYNPQPKIDIPVAV